MNTGVIENPGIRRVAGIIGVLGTVAAAAYSSLLAGLTVPAPFYWLFIVAGLVWIVLAIRLWSKHPWWTLAIPVAVLAVALAAIEIGVRMWGWAP